MSDKPSFASRWAKRKQAVLEERQATEEVVENVEVVEKIEAAPEKTEAEVLAEFGLTDPDEMVKGDDFSGFMDTAIPTQLRNRALRKLWTSNSALANLDGLLDYGDDFTIKEGAADVIATAYKVGKGYFDKDAEVEETEGATEEELVADTDVNDSLTFEDEVPVDASAKVESVRPPGTKPDLTPLSTEASSVEVMEIAAKPAAVSRKRMNFSF